MPEPTPPLPPLLAIVGTTASGKSDVGIALAERLGGEIVSADSRQVYRGLDIGAGKVTAEERARVPHHLLDVADVRERFTVSEYQRLAFDAIEDIAARGRLPILVGGTGLYVRAVVDNPSYPKVEPSPELRAELEAMSVETLAERLAAVDPQAMATIDLRNPRRLVRAIEVTLASGIPFSAQQQLGSPRVRALLLGVSWPADELRRRVEQRVDARLNSAHSMVDEVSGLLDQGVPAERLQELGLEYRFITRHLLGEMDLATMRRQLITAIYQFSRRQLTWFRRDPRIVWLDAGRDLADQAQQYAEEWLRDCTYNPASANG